MKSSVVRARVDEHLKKQAAEVLKQNGLEMSDAIRLFLRQVVRRGGLPFPVRDLSTRGVSEKYARGRQRNTQKVAGLRRGESRLAKELDIELLLEHRALTPSERLAAFLTHSRQIAQLQEAGEALRERPREV